MVTVTVPVRHFHGHERTHHHRWEISANSDHPDARDVLLHVFKGYVTHVTDSGLLYVEDRDLEDILPRMNNSVSNLLEVITEVTILER